MKKVMKKIAAFAAAVMATLMMALTPAAAAPVQAATYSYSKYGIASSITIDDLVVGSWAGDQVRLTILKGGRYIGLFGMGREEQGRWSFTNGNLLLARPEEDVLFRYSKDKLYGTYNGKSIVLYNDTKCQVPEYQKSAKLKDFRGIWRACSVSSGTAIAAPAKEIFTFIEGKKVFMSESNYDGSSETSRYAKATSKKGVLSYNVRFNGKKYSVKMYILKDGSLYGIYTAGKSQTAVCYRPAVDKYIQQR